MLTSNTASPLELACPTPPVLQACSASSSNAGLAAFYLRVLRGKWMPLLADTGHMDYHHRSLPSQRVDAPSHRFKVIRIGAWSIPTQVIEFQPIGDGAVGELERRFMNQSCSSLDADVSVALFLERAGPHPAGTEVGAMRRHGAVAVKPSKDTLSDVRMCLSYRGMLARFCAVARRHASRSKNLSAVATRPERIRHAGGRGSTGPGAVDSAAGSYQCGDCKELSAALTANSRNGTLTGHRGSSGVSPRPLRAVRGHFAAFNYTAYQIPEAA
jgi:hypothetical protein